MARLEGQRHAGLHNCPRPHPDARRRACWKASRPHATAQPVSAVLVSRFRNLPLKFVISAAVIILTEEIEVAAEFRAKDGLCIQSCVASGRYRLRLRKALASSGKFRVR